MLKRKKIKDDFSSFDSCWCLLIAIASFTHFNKTNVGAIQHRFKTKPLDNAA